MNPGPFTYFRNNDELPQSTTASPADEPPAVASDDDALLRAADHPATPVEWLWPGRIPLGKVSLLVADPGLGKSLLAIDVAARATRNARWPDQREGEAPAEPTPGDESGSAGASPSTLHAPCSVLLLSAEDDLADTIRPRIDAARANPYRVYILQSVAELRRDVGRLRDAVDRVRNCRLIVIDPLNAYVGPSDSHFHTVICRVLRPLTELARDKRLAVLALAHLRKMHGAALHRAAGSLAFVAASRALWTIVRDPVDRSRHLFLPLKHNLAPAACGLAFRIEPDSANAAPRIAWEPERLTAPPEELLTPPPKRRPPSPDRADARAFLHEALAAGPRPAREVIQEGEAQGFLRRTLRRALHEIGGQAEKRGFLAGWWWSLQESAPRDATKPDSTSESPTPQNRDPFEGDTLQPPQTPLPDSQLDPDFQRALFAELATRFAAIDPQRLARAQRRTRLRRKQEETLQIGTGSPTPCAAE